MCLSVKSHLTLEASLRPENAVTYSVGDESQKICGVFSETAPLPRSSAPSLGWPHIRSPADNTHVHCAYDVMLGLHAVSSPCVLYSFTMIILGLESSSLSCVSCWSSVCTRDCSPAI